jgi:hypothetical protein
MWVWRLRANTGPEAWKGRLRRQFKFKLKLEMKLKMNPEMKLGLEMKLKLEMRPEMKLGVENLSHRARCSSTSTFNLNPPRSGACGAA